VNVPETELFDTPEGMVKRCGLYAPAESARAKLQNPRLLEVHFHTLRHCALTMYQHKVHDIPLTARFAGHRNINNTMKYIHLEQLLFNDAQDDFIVKTAKTPEEAARLIEVGFQLQDVIDGVHLYKKRK
jgi:integrase